MSNYIHISKLDAAKRQLEFGINTFFNRGDLVVIHNLVSSADNILYDLLNSQDLDSYRSEVLSVVKDEFRGEVKSKFNEAWNFFKHADKDPEKTLKFIPNFTSYIIWSAIDGYQRLTGELTPLMLSFRVYFYVQNADILKDDEVKKAFKDFRQDESTRSRSFYLELAEKYRKKQVK